MRKLALIFALAVPLALPGSVALAHDMPPGMMCQMVPSGMDFGQHVADHAQGGMTGAAMNPGMHQGYSICTQP